MNWFMIVIGILHTMASIQEIVKANYLMGLVYFCWAITDVALAFMGGKA